MARRIATMLVGFVGASAFTVGVSAEPPGLQFTDTNELAPSADELARGVEINLCNSTASDVPVVFRLDGFSFTANSGDGNNLAVEASEVLRVPPPIDSLRAGACAAVTLTAKKDHAPLAEPSYSGTLLAVSAGAGTAALTVTVPGTPDGSKATTAIGEVSLHGQFSPFENAGTAMTASGITFRYAGETAPTLQEGTELAVLANGADVARLVSSAPSVAHGPSQVITVPVRVQGAGQNGTYVGRVDTDVAGSEDEPIEVSIAVADWWGLAALVGIAGTGLGFLAKFAAGKWLPLLRWRRLRHVIPHEYGRASDALAANSEVVARRFTQPSEATIAEEVQTLAEYTEAYRRSVVLFDATAPEYKDLVDRYALISEDARDLGASTPDGVAKKVIKLDDRIAAFAATFLTDFPHSAPPTVLRSARGVAGHPAIGEDVRPIQLPVGGATKLCKDATAAAALLDTWDSCAKSFRRYRFWLQSFVSPLPQDLPILRRTEAKLAEIRQELFAVSDAEELTSARVAQDLELVYRTLAELGGRYGLHVPSNWEEGDRRCIADRSARYFAVYTRDVDGSVEAPNLVETAEPVPHDRTPPPKPTLTTWGLGSRVLAWTLEGLVALGSGLALLTAGRALYVDKPFGSLGDYLALFSLGLGAELLLTALVNAIAAWRVAPRASAPATT